MKKILLVFCFGLAMQVSFAMCDKQTEAVQSSTLIKQSLQDRIDKIERQKNIYRKKSLTSKENEILNLLKKERIAILKSAIDDIIHEEENNVLPHANFTLNDSINRATIRFYEKKSIGATKPVNC